ncbi:MAG: hemolysin III family protein, partial [Rhodococcus sp. (in: high G+C Gram-positive bacteria)]
MTAFGLDELPVKPRLRGWIHLWAFGVSVIAGVVLVVLSATRVSGTAAMATAVYSVT